MSPIHRLTELMSEFPGIGPRQARRFVQYMLRKANQWRAELARGILDLARMVSPCAECLRYTENTENGLCRLCANADRDIETLMVVEKDVDIDGVEASEAYRGRYFVFGGLLSLTGRKNGAHTEVLFKRVRRSEPKEIIFALAATPEGDYTARELMRELAIKHPTMRLTLLGRGLSVGGEIEYADRETLRNALKNRS